MGRGMLELEQQELRCFTIEVVSWSDQSKPCLCWQKSQFGKIEALEEGAVDLGPDLQAVRRHGEDVGVGGDHLGQVRD